MTLDLSNVVTVNITRQTQFPQGPGFGTLLIVGPNATGVIPLAERVRTYSSITGVSADFAAIDEEYKAANAYFAQNPRPTQVAIGVRDELAPALAAEMDLIVDANDAWYGVMLTAEGRISNDAGLATELATWTEARNKLHVTASNEAAAIAAGGGLPGTMNAAGFYRSSCFYDPNADSNLINSYPEAAFFGKMLTVDFNGVKTTRTGKFKKLAGITTSPLTQNQLNFLLGDPASSPRYGNAYVSIGGTPMTLNGTMASGEFFDVMHGIDWQQAEIQTRVFGRLATMPKVPLTDPGMEILLNETRLALQQGVTNGLLAPTRDVEGNLLDAFEVSAPSVALSSPSDLSARKAPPITFVARVSGAVHSITVNGTITV